MYKFNVYILNDLKKFIKRRRFEKTLNECANLFGKACAETERKILKCIKNGNQ